MTRLLPAALAAITGFSAPLQGLLGSLDSAGDSAHANMVVAAVHASPMLNRQLDALATSGRLRAIVLKPSEGARFGASHQNGVIALTPGFLDAQTPTSGDVAATTRNLVFILGYEAAKVDSAPAIDAEEQKEHSSLKGLFANAPKGTSPDITSFVQRGMQLHIADEARAYLQGWNDEIDAATTAKGATLTPTETFKLLTDSRNTKPVLRAAMLAEDQRLAPTGDLRFPATERNLKAMETALGQLSVPDFQ